MKRYFILKTLTAFIFLTLNSIAFAQGHWKDITLFTTSGDSIHGLVSYKNKFKAFKFLPVKDKSTGTIKIVTPATIKSFTIQLTEQKIYFKSLIIEADYSSDELDKLSSSPELELTKDTVFAQVLLKGKRNLYYFVDNKAYKKHFLLETEKEPATDLINKSYYTDASRMIVGYNRTYRSQLRTSLAESGTISKERINETPFNKKEIVKIVKDYNTASASATTTPLYEYTEEKAVFDFGVTAGVNNTSILFKSEVKSYNQLKFNASTGVNLGLALNVIFPSTRKRLSLYNEVLYTSFKSNSPSFYEYYENADWYRELKSASIQASYVKLFTALRYQSTRTFAPYMQLGFVNGYAIHHATNANYEIRFYSSLSTEDLPLIDFRPYEQSLFGGIGAHYKKIGLEVRYERGNGMSKSSHINSISNYLYCLLNYTF